MATETTFTGSSRVEPSTCKIRPGAAFRLLRVGIHLSAAPTTSENYTIQLQDQVSSAYDVVLAKQDLSSGSLTDLMFIFGAGYEFKDTDTIRASWANSNAKTYGLKFVYELL